MGSPDAEFVPKVLFAVASIFKLYLSRGRPHHELILGDLASKLALDLIEVCRPQVISSSAALEASP